MKNRKGFTLIELLAVIIILGILMIIAIPSVTSYINNSRKSAYVDTAKEIVSGARNLVNEGKLEMFDTGTTYYIPVSCITTENGQKSPYGDFAEDQAFVVVTYTGSNYNYFWISRDTTGQGVKTITPVGELDEDDIKSDISAGEITPTEPAESGKTTIKVLSKDNCNEFIKEKTAVEQLLETVSPSVLYNIDEENHVYIFRGANPSNYVNFNCDSNGQNCEKWRIIGIYGDQLKIQRTLEISNQKYNNSMSDGNNWEGSILETYLNQETEGGYYYNLNQSAKNMITTGIWYVGAANRGNKAPEAYANAIVTLVSKKIGLMASYESLYATSQDSCYTNTNGYYYGNGSCGTLDWMKTKNVSWTLTAVNNYSGTSLTVGSTGRVDDNSVDLLFDIYPAVFLNPSVKIANDGMDGTSSKSYNLTLN